MRINMNKIIIDTETTGLSPENSKIVELAAVEIDEKNRPTGKEWHSYINPQCVVPPEVVEIHGLDNAFLQDKPLFDDVKDSFLAFIGNQELIGHNIEFDLSFLNHQLGYTLPNSYLDTVALARVVFKGQRVSLDALCKKLRVKHILPSEEPRGALADAKTLAQVYVKLRRKRKRQMKEAILKDQQQG